MTYVIGNRKKDDKETTRAVWKQVSDKHEKKNPILFSV